MGSGDVEAAEELGEEESRKQGRTLKRAKLTEDTQQQLPATKLYVKVKEECKEESPSSLSSGTKQAQNPLASLMIASQAQQQNS